MECKLLHEENKINKKKHVERVKAKFSVKRPTFYSNYDH